MYVISPNRIYLSLHLRVINRYRPAREKVSNPRESQPEKSEWLTLKKVESRLLPVAGLGPKGAID